jgi:hypothetical protein
MPLDQSKISEIERVHDNHPDKELRAYKTLGVYFDEHLTFARHVEVLIAKLSRAIYMLGRVKNVLPTAALKSISSTPTSFTVQLSSHAPLMPT